MTHDISDDAPPPPRAQALAVRATTKAAATAKKPATRKTASKAIAATSETAFEPFVALWRCRYR